MLKCYNSTNYTENKDDMDALCPTNSSPKYILLPASRHKWHVLKIKILGKVWFSKLTLQTFLFKSLVFKVFLFWDKTSFFKKSFKRVVIKTSGKTPVENDWLIIAVRRGTETSIQFFRRYWLHCPFSCNCTQMLIILSIKYLNIFSQWHIYFTQTFARKSLWEFLFSLFLYTSSFSTQKRGFLFYHIIHFLWPCNIPIDFFSVIYWRLCTDLHAIHDETIISLKSTCGLTCGFMWWDNY